MAIVRAERKDRQFLMELYKEAFPKCERAPFFLLWRQYKRSIGDFLIARYDNEDIGFVYMIASGDLAYLSYLAIHKSYRGKGYGSLILSELKDIYAGKRIFLAREKLDEDADNYVQRQKRHEFYLKNGFKDLSCSIKEDRVVYDAMGVGGEVYSAEYDDMVNIWLGRFIKRFINWDMRIIENN